MARTKRIAGIGYFKDGALYLTQEATRGAGHLAPQGGPVDSDAAQATRKRIDNEARALVEETGKLVEVLGTARDAQPWVVDVMYPEGHEAYGLGYVQGRGAA